MDFQRDIGVVAGGAPRQPRGAPAGTRALVAALRPQHLVLAALLLVAAVLRLYGLTAESLWHDELATVAKLSAPPWDPRVWQLIVHDVHPPGHVVMQWLFASLLGDSEFALRFPSALCGVAGVFVVYELGRRWFSRAAGWAGALLAAISPFLIEYSQQVRAYAPLFFFSGWTLLCWLELSRPPTDARKRRWRVISAALVTTANAYLHYSGLLCSVAIAALAIAFASVRTRNRLPDLLATVGLCLLLYAPWTLGLLEDLETGGLGYLRPPGVELLKQFPTVALPGYVYLICAMLAAFRSRAGPGEDRPRAFGSPAALFLALCSVVLVLGFYFKSVVGEPIYNERNLMVAWPPVFVLLGAAVTQAGEGLRALVARGVILATLATVVVLDFVYVDEFYSTQTKEHYRQATRVGLEWIQDKQRTRLVVLGGPDRFDYYLHHFGFRGKVAATAWSREALVHTVDRQFERGARYVLVLTGHTRARGVLRSLQRRFRVEHSKRFPGTSAALLRSKKKGPVRGTRKRRKKR